MAHLHVGENRRRTWILCRSDHGILLKHDHRHEDGSEDAVTQYGGWTTHRGSATRQFFPADQQTVDLIPDAGGNVWWFDMTPQKSLTYNLIRLGTDRVFTLTFDISKSFPNPQLARGWEA